MAGLFVTAEGGEGVGKSAFLRKLSGRLGELQIGTYLTREPGGTPSADKIRAIFASPEVDDPFVPKTEAFLVSAARAQHVERVVKPKLASGIWVICDRFTDSTRVYQGVLGGLDPAFLEPLIDLATGGLQPDITFLLDCDVETAMRRCASRPDQIEPIKRYDDAGLATHSKIRYAFQQLARDYASRIVILDAAKSLQEVVAEALGALGERGFV